MTFAGPFHYQALKGGRLFHYKQFENDQARAQPTEKPSRPLEPPGQGHKVQGQRVLPQTYQGQQRLNPRQAQQSISQDQNHQKVNRNQESVTRAQSYIIRPAYREADSFLIDFSAEKGWQPTPVDKLQKSQTAPPQAQPNTLIDSSIAEKYEFLPQPLGEKSNDFDDPFVVSADVKSVLVPKRSNNSIMFSLGDKHTSKETTFSAEAEGACAAEGNAAPPIPPRIYGNVPMESTTETSGATNYYKKGVKVIPVAPTQTVNVTQSQPIPVPTSSVQLPLGTPPKQASPTPPKRGLYYSMPPVEDQTKVPPSTVQQVRMYDQVPEEEPPQSTRAQVSNVNSSQPNAAPEKVEKAFDWLSDAVVGLSFKKDESEKSDKNNYLQSEKAPLDSWDSKSMKKWKNEESTPVQVGDVKPQVLQGLYKAPDKYASVNQSNIGAACTDQSEGGVSSGEDEWEEFDNSGVSESDTQPPRPPRRRDVPPPVDHSPGSRIHPMVQSGEKRSDTHYFLLPKRHCEPEVAEVKPFSVSRNSNNTGAEYQNLDNLSDKIAGASTNLGYRYSRQSLTGLNAVSEPQSKTLRYSSTPPGVQIPNPGATPRTQHTQAAIPTSMLQTTGTRTQQSDSTDIPAELKIEKVQLLVHGVTKEECQAALMGSQWNVKEAVKCLKIEQLFRLGLTSRERCEKLLDTFQWNLEMAGSVLMDEIKKANKS